MDKNYQNYLDQIIEFNSDKALIAMRERYNEPSFFEIISKQRSETTFSAFLKWLFQGNSTMFGHNAPIMMLLDTLVRRSGEHKGTVKLIDDDLKKNIVTRKMKMMSLKAETEKAISELAEMTMYRGFFDTSDMRKIVTGCQDRVDLYIEGDAVIDDEKKKIQIIIENKIDSKEGGVKVNKKFDLDDYVKASQTKRYYMGSHCEYEGVYQIYVYLTPQLASSSDNIDEHFIRLSYQDILDDIITPLLNSSSLPARSRFFLEEFSNELTFPSIEGSSVHTSIAKGTDFSQKVTKLWDEKYKDIVTDSVIATSQTPIWYLEGSYYDYQPKRELLQLLISKGYYEELEKWCSSKQSSQFKDELCDGYWYNSRSWYPIIENFAKGKEIDVCQYSKKFATMNDSILDLLCSFWEENRKFLCALMDSLDSKCKKEIQCLLNTMSKRDNTKYFVFFDGQCCNPEQKPTGKAETVYTIISQWADIKRESGSISLDDLNQVFPMEKVNTYYAKAKCFRNLFYIYKEDGSYCYDDGDAKGNAVEGNWDFYTTNKKHNIITSDGEVTLLKMWRKDDMEKFVKYAMELCEFKGRLEVIVSK